MLKNGILSFFLLKGASDNNAHNTHNKNDNRQRGKGLFSRVFYSQDGEDAVLDSFFEEKGHGYKGFYVDIGALHPLRFSNTQYFYEKGWRGMNVDATPGSMNEFKRWRKEDFNIEKGVALNNESLFFYCFEESALNSFDVKLSEERERAGWKLNEKKKIKTIAINELLEKYLPSGQKIDFINIDIEGFDFKILRELDWDKYSAEFLLVEDLSVIDQDIFGYGRTENYNFLRGKGYSLVAKTRRTSIFKKELNKNNVNH